MTTPPPLPQVLPPSLPTKRRQIPTVVYCLFFSLLFAVNAGLTYRQAVTRFPNNSATAVGYVQGGLLVPLVIAAGVACIWKQNRGFRGVVRVLFWVSLITLFGKISQFAGPARSWPNKPAAGNAGSALQLLTGHHQPGVPERERSA